MAGNVSDGDLDIDWDTEDDLEIEGYGVPSCSGTTPNGGEAIAGSSEANTVDCSSRSQLVDHFVGMGFSEAVVTKVIQENGEGNTDLILESLLNYTASTSAGPSRSKLFDHFVGMGFPEEMVAKAIQENGEDNTDLVLEALLTYSALEKSPQAEQQVAQRQLDSDDVSECGSSLMNGFSDLDSSDDEMFRSPLSDKDDKLSSLMSMGYSEGEAAIAMERCGPNSSIAELTDFICAAQMAKATDALLVELDEKPKPRQLNNSYPPHKKRKMLERKMLNGEDENIRLPNPMIGFGVPTESGIITHRALPEAAVGPPYFYYENVALAPKGVWDTISRFLYDVEPEFVDSKYFCACARKRGYVHNLPIENRYPILPLPPTTIQDALPMTRKWWPSWDPRTQLNCLVTAYASSRLTERIRKALENYDYEPPLHVQKYVLDECRKWNLVWVGRNKVAPLEPDEVETLLGFPRNHTRGGGASRTERYKSLGNSFQVDTVAYHLSVLKDLYPQGMNVLSLFSGIGGGEVALHRLGVRLNNVVTVEISEVNRNIFRSWWEQTNQKGTLVDIPDVQHLTADRIEQMMDTFGGFDLVIGGSPCNNLAGGNRHHRDGLEGKESSLFYEYIRILEAVKCMSRRNE